MRRFLFTLTQEAASSPLLDAALALAGEFKAFISACCPHDLEEEGSAGFNEETVMALPRQQIELLLERKEEHKVVYENFFRRAQELGFRWTKEPSAQDLPAAFMAPLSDKVRPPVWPEIPLTDLVIFPQAYQTDVRGWGAFESVMIDARRLVLVLSHQKPLGPKDIKCTIAWDGSVQASRCLTRAIPFLMRSSKVTLLCVDRPKREPVVTEFALSYLKLYGIEAQVVHSTSEKSAHSVGEAILAGATNQGADLLVMGGYGSSGAFLESLVGGVTQYVRTNTTINLLMTH